MSFCEIHHWKVIDLSLELINEIISEEDFTVPYRSYAYPSTKDLPDIKPFVFPAGFRLVPILASKSGTSRDQQVEPITIAGEAVQSDPTPMVHSFVLTSDAKGAKIYGFCYTRYHKWSDDPSARVKVLRQKYN
jgi:hypothetical protein